MMELINMLSGSRMQSLGSKGDAKVPANPQSAADVIPITPAPLMPDARKWNSHQWRQFRAASEASEAPKGSNTVAGPKVDAVEVSSSSQFAAVGTIKG